MKLMVCEKCGARVITRLMASNGGRDRMICDPQLVTYWRHRSGNVLVLSVSGVLTYAELDGDPGLATGMGWLPHRCQEVSRR